MAGWAAVCYAVLCCVVLGSPGYWREWVSITVCDGFVIMQACVDVGEGRNTRNG